jgi:hypothetical protein
MKYTTKKSREQGNTTGLNITTTIIIVVVVVVYSSEVQRP